MNVFVSENTIILIYWRLIVKMTISIISEFCNPILIIGLTLIVVLETLTIILQQILLHKLGVKPL